MGITITIKWDFEWESNGDILGNQFKNEAISWEISMGSQWQLDDPKIS